MTIPVNQGRPGDACATLAPSGDVDDSVEGAMWGRVRRARDFMTEVGPLVDAAAPRRERSLAQEAVLAALDPRTGKIWNNARFAVPAAVLLELVHLGRCRVTGTGRRAEITVRDATPTGDHDLDEALLLVGSGVLGQRVVRLVAHSTDTTDVARRMVDEGLLVDESRRLLRVFPLRRYRSTPLARRDDVVARLRAVLLDGVTDERTTLLAVALVDVDPKVFVPKERVREARTCWDPLLARVGAEEAAVVEAARLAVQRAND